MGEKQVESFLPLREATFFIMLCLVTKPRHGYAIMKDAERLSAGRVVLSTGTLYGAIQRLLGQGWIVPVEVSPAESDGRSRTTYALTDLGRRVFNAEVARLESLWRMASGSMKEAQA